METIADLHLHSHYSIATRGQADLEHLDLWGRYKGVHLVGTGDCTHPQWLQEMATRLAPVAEGTYVLKEELALPLEPDLRGPAWEGAAAVRFVVSGEVSAIYKKAGRVARSICCSSPAWKRRSSYRSVWPAWATSPRMAAPSWGWMPNTSWNWSWPSIPAPW